MPIQNTNELRDKLLSGKDSNNVSVPRLNNVTLLTVLDANGDITYLQISDLGGGGGRTSDTTSANQSLQITEAQSTNTKLESIKNIDFGTETTLSGIYSLLQLQKDIEQTIWQDGSGIFYIHRTIYDQATGGYSYTNTLPDGTNYTPVGTSVLAVSNKDYEIKNTYYIVNTTNGIYYSNIKPDVIYQTDIINTATGAITATIWKNQTTNTIINEANINISHLDVRTPPLTVVNQFSLETTQSLIKNNTDNIDIALSVLRDALRGTNNKTNSDIVTTLSSLLTELQLKADLTETQPVGATARVCTGTQMITTLSSVTPASLTIPALSVVAEIQADGGVVRVRRDAGTPTATTGWRIDDGMSLTVDSVLANVRLLAQSGSTTNVQIAYFDRV